MGRKLNLLLISIIVLLMAGLNSCDSDSKESSVAAPTALAVNEVTVSNATLSWSGTATSYEVVVGTRTETVTAKAFSATGLTAETEYAWKVRAKEGGEFSNWVDGAKFTTKATAGSLAPPTALTVGEVTATTAALSWSGVATSYEVIVGTKAETVNAKVFDATALTAETGYTWKVRAKEGGEFSDWVDGERFTTKSASSVAPPNTLAVDAVTTTTASLSWSGAATSYEVMVDNKTKTVTAKSFSATGLTAETEYAWKVRAKKGSEVSDWVDGPKFTTAVLPSTDIIITNFEVPGTNLFYGDDYSPGQSNNFHVTIYEKGAQIPSNGMMFKMDFHAPISGGMNSIAPGTYNIASGSGGGNNPMTLDPKYSYYESYKGEVMIADDSFASGSAIVSLEGDVYTIKYSFVCKKSGYKFLGTYVGALDYQYPEYRAPGQRDSSLFNWRHKPAL